MKTLHLLRHAKSSWADPDQPDRERPLAPRGRRAARRLRARLEAQKVRVELVLCSPAARTTHTLALIRSALGDEVEVVVEEELYGAGAAEILARIRRLPGHVGSAMVVGHNPGLQDLALLLAREGRLRDQVEARFPTAALATLAIPSGGWRALEPACADLITYVTPRELE